MVQGITDTDDDVRAVAADGMLPIADDIVRLLSNEARGTVLTWCVVLEAFAFNAFLIIVFPYDCNIMLS